MVLSGTPRVYNRTSVGRPTSDRPPWFSAVYRRFLGPRRSLGSPAGPSSRLRAPPGHCRPNRIRKWRFAETIQRRSDPQGICGSPEIHEIATLLFWVPLPAFRFHSELNTPRPNSGGLDFAPGIQRGSLQNFRRARAPSGRPPSQSGAGPSETTS